MGGIAGDTCSGDHVHLQERTENIGVIIQNLLLKFDGKFSSLCRVKLGAHLFDQVRDFCIFIGTEIVTHAWQTAGGKEVLGVAGRCRDQGRGINIPALHLCQEITPVGCAVDIKLNSDVLERGLRGLGQKRKLLTAGIGQPADRKLLPVLFADAVAIGILPSRFFQNFGCTFRIIGFRLYIFSAECAEAVGKRAVSGLSVSFQKRRDKSLLIDSHGNGLADCRILNDRARHVHGCKKGSGCVDG